MSECDALMRPGVVWFGEQFRGMNWNELKIFSIANLAAS